MHFPDFTNKAQTYVVCLMPDLREIFDVCVSTHCRDIQPAQHMIHASFCILHVDIHEKQVDGAFALISFVDSKK
jgi:hypothetical protein